MDMARTRESATYERGDTTIGPEVAADDREPPLEVKTKAETGHVPGHVGAKVDPDLSIQGTGVACCVEDIVK